MTKVQKIWFSVFLAMFLVPEILFGGLLGTFLNLRFLPLIRTSSFFSFYPSLGHINLWSEIIGVIGLIFIINKYPYRNNLIKYFFYGILLLVLFSLLTIIYFYYTFNPSFL